ncbi:inositol requiring 1-1 [Perilla frutescens var. hirtella]|nr:inositol requiring 1-1 [Perilla frutescens var. hirtella]
MNSKASAVKLDNEQLSELRDIFRSFHINNDNNFTELRNSVNQIVNLKYNFTVNSPSCLATLCRRWFHSVRDLLRVMHNKLNHYREIPAEIQELIGPVPEGFDRYFSRRFPKLLIEVYKVMFTYCSKEDSFAKYFNDSRL